MLKRITILLILSTVNILTAQNNINTPYSLFGLGVENNTATGGLTGLGNSGIAQKTYNQINIYNPSNLANLPKETFLQDYGISGGGSTLKNYNTSESRINANVSHVLFAFQIKKGLGVSFGVLPYTTTGYKIDLVSNIEGSSGKYVTRLIGTGGINNFYISSGIKITKNLSVGVGFSALFGSVNQNSQLYLNSLVDIKDKNHYTGVKLNTGLQYTLFSNDKNQTTLGSVVEFPTFLGGTQTRTSSKILSNGASIALEKGVKKSLKDYELPLSVGVGLSSSFEKFTVNVDYKKKFWENTNQSINSGRYTNQSIYAFGLEYKKYNKNANFFRLVNYRFGLNYNSGFLKISNQQISSYFASFGMGIPINRQGINRLNISYSYGKQGTTNRRLVQENYHKISLNFSFNGHWFQPRKIL